MSFLPELRGYNSRVMWEVHCGGMALGVVVVLGIVLDLAEIAPAFCQPQQAAWSSL